MDSTLLTSGFNLDEIPISGLENVQMGTTIMAMKYSNGVILCADSRTSNGPVVVNKFAKKITPITNNIYMCRAGSAADTQAVAAIIQNQMLHQRVSSKKNHYKLALPRVRSAASLTKLICYENKHFLSAGFIIAGVDEVDGFQVYGIPLGGSLFQRDFICFGSGSTYILGLSDTLYKKNMSKDVALSLCKRLVNHAMMRDGASGGIIRYVIIDNDLKVEEGYVRGEDIELLEPNIDY